MEKHKQTFTCQDAAGKTYDVHEYVQIIKAGHMDDPHATVEGMGRLVLDNGGPVNDKGDGTYLIVHTDTVIRPL